MVWSAINSNSLLCSRGEYSCLPSSAFQEPIKCLLFCTWLLLPPPSCKLAAFCDKKPLRRCKRINWGRPWWHRNVATSSLSSLLKSDHEWDSLSLSPGPGLVVGLSRAPARDTQMHNSQHSRVAAHTGGVVGSAPTSSSRSHFTFVEEEVVVRCQPAVRVRHKYLGLGTPRGGGGDPRHLCT